VQQRHGFEAAVSPDHVNPGDDHENKTVKRQAFVVGTEKRGVLGSMPEQARVKILWKHIFMHRMGNR